MVQTVEKNRGRLEARALVGFEASAEAVCFPHVAQAARLTRYVDRADNKSEEVEEEWLISSRTAKQLSVEQMLEADRRYWGIENGLHLRLDVSAGEDRSRVRHPRAAWNLAMMRRATLSLAIYWIQRCRNKRKATLSGFYDAMDAKGCRKALSLATRSQATWLPNS